MSTHTKTGPTSERHDGPTPNGGVYSIAYFRGPDGAPTSKGLAVAMEIQEFDAQDRMIRRTYFGPRSQPAEPGEGSPL